MLLVTTPLGFSNIVNDHVPFIVPAESSRLRSRRCVLTVLIALDFDCRSAWTLNAIYN
jgi:hypothetical protein